eukprot:gene31258-38621_t
MPVGVTIVDSDLTIRFWNPAFCQLQRLPADVMHTGVTMGDVFRTLAARGDYGPGDIGGLVAAREALCLKFEPHNFTRISVDGVVLNIVGRPIYGADGAVSGFVTIYHDVTQPGVGSTFWFTARLGISAKSMPTLINQISDAAGELLASSRASAMMASLQTSRILPACALAAIPAFAADVAPVAAKTPWQETRHGEVVTDDYRWLHKKEDPAVIAYLNAENGYTEAATAAGKPLVDKLYAEIKGRMQEVDLSVPTRRGNYYYYSRTEAGQQYPLNCRRRAGAGMAYDDRAPEEILLDQNEMAQGKKFFALGAMVVSPDERLMAYTTDVTGFRQYQMHVKDLKTGKLLPASMPRTTSIAWASDNKTLFVTQEDATTKRSDRLFSLSAAGGAPVQRYHEPVEQFSVYVNRDRDGKHLVQLMRSTDTTEVRLLDAAKPNGAFRAVLPRERGHRYSVTHRDGRLYIRTDKDARNFRIVTAPLAAPQPKNWVELVRPQPAGFGARRQAVAAAQVEQDIGGLPDQQLAGAQHRRRKRGARFFGRIDGGLGGRHAGFSARHVLIGGAGLLQRQPHEFATALDGGPVVQFINHRQLPANCRSGHHARNR